MKRKIFSKGAAKNLLAASYSSRIPLLLSQLVELVNKQEITI